MRASFKLSSLLLLTVGLIPFNAAAQNTNLPADYGTSVAGAQDSFAGTSLSANWVSLGSTGNIWTVANGVLTCATTTTSQGGNPNHLVYEGTIPYNAATQTVLIRIRPRILAIDNSENTIIGPGVAINTGSHTDAGMNWMLIGGGATGQGVPNGFAGAVFLWDYQAYYSGYTNSPLPWQTNTWYWMRVNMIGSSFSGKIWLADGSAAEPASYQETFSQALGSLTTSYAGIKNASGKIATFDVSYFLLEASGLPSITVSPVLIQSIVQQPQTALIGTNQTASFSVGVSATIAPSYQWQYQPAGGSGFSNVTAGTGGTNATYTTPLNTAANNGDQYQVVVSAGSQSVTSSPAAVTIAPLPTLLWAKTLGSSTSVTLAFSEPVSVPSGVSDFTFTTGGATVLSVAAGEFSTNLVLTTTPLSGTNYALTVAGVQDSTYGMALASTTVTLDFSVLLPADFGASVNGAQDTFTGPSLSTNWVILANAGGPPHVVQAGGMVTATTMWGNPSHLIYEGGTAYNSTTQEVLIRLRVRQMLINTAGNDIVGPAVAINTGFAHGAAVNWMLSGGYNIPNSVPGATYLYDTIAWNPTLGINTGDMPWSSNTWYWMRLNLNGSNSSSGGTQGAFSGKVWRADGSEAEPANWQQTWSRASGNGTTELLSGFAGIKFPSPASSTVETPFQVDVNYFLVKASGLPSITVSPAVNNISITNQPQNITVAAGQTAGFSAQADGGSPLSFQWQVAPAANPTNFANVSAGSGGTTSNYTTAALAAINNGDQYQVVVSLGTTAVTSSVATVTVPATPPALELATTGGPTLLNQVIVAFSEAITTPTTANFSINSGAVAISAVAAGSAPNEVVLTTGTLATNTTYTLTASSISDLYGNTLTSGQVQIGFTAMPSDFGAVVNGAQDSFNGASISSNWVFYSNPSGAANYSQAGGMVSFGTMSGNPVHLLYEGGIPYNSTTQEVLMRIRVRTLPYDTSANNIAGVAAAVNTNFVVDSGVNWMITADNSGLTYGAEYLYDEVAYAGAYSFAWQSNTWYWLRLNMNGSASANDGQTGSFSAKIWAADGLTAEPASWQSTFTHAANSGGNLFGFAGIKCSVNGEASAFDVDYFLVKASGLPAIVVSPNTSNPNASITINTQPQSVTVGPSQTASFAVGATGNFPLTYQWQTAAAAHPTNFANVSAGTGGTTSNYTTGTLSATNNGDQYQAIVSIGNTSVTSSVATLTVQATPPALVFAGYSPALTQVSVLFSEGIVLPSTANFSINNNVNVYSVTAGATPNSVILATDPLAPNTVYTLSVTNIADFYGNILATAQAQISFALPVPADFGSTVNGAQDNFTGPSLSTNWAFLSSVAGQTNFSQANGMLTVKTLQGNPNHLLYVGGTYNDMTQEVLMRIRIDNLPIDTSANNLAGAAVGVNTGFEFDSGVNWMLTGGEPTNYINNPSLVGVAGAAFLYDYTGYGPADASGDMPWQTNTWYWMRLNMNGFASGSNGAVGNFSAKVWLADGTEAEPVNWQVTWTTPAHDGTSLSGYAGIKCSSSGETCQFDVDYFLVKASGLPAITVSPLTNHVAIVAEPQNATAGTNQTANFTVAADGDVPASYFNYQWQVAPAATPTDFANVSAGSGGTTSNYTTGMLAAINNGDEYRVIVYSGSTQITSAPPAILTIAPPPTVLWAKAEGSSDSVALQFSEPVMVPSDASGFTFATGGATVSSVAAGESSSSLVLSTSTLSLGASYTLAVSGVQDLYANTMASTNVALDFTVYLPFEYGQSVSGFQDNFSAPTMDTNWVAVGVDATNFDNLFLQDGDGLLHVSSPASTFVSNPNRLLYNPTPGYDSATQEVLMRLRVTAFTASVGGSSGLDSVGGATVGNNTNIVSGAGSGGIDWLLADYTGSGAYTDIPGFQAAFLDDWSAWGAGFSFPWTTNTWYWLRLFQNGTSTNGGPNIFAKAWLADGTTPEPAAWQASWSNTNRTGLAGIDAASLQTLGDVPVVFNFDVSYFLLEASGLPTITVAPSSFALVAPLSLSVTQPAPGSILLQWNYPLSASLQTATSLNGTWTTLTGVTSPFTTNATGAGMFFRLVQP